MNIRRSYHVTPEEKYALAAALIVFALSILIVFYLRIGSFLELHQQEVTLVISSNLRTPSILFESQSISAPTTIQHQRSPRQKKREGGIPVAVPLYAADTAAAPDIAGNGTHDTSSSMTAHDGLTPQAAFDSLIILYPGFRRFALYEEMKKTPKKSRNDSLLAWAKENFVTQMSQRGKIDQATLNQLMMLQRYQNYGPYHIVTPSVGVGVGFDYTEVLKKIISIFEKAPKD
jgi:hypothetical protein